MAVKTGYRSSVLAVAVYHLGAKASMQVWSESNVGTDAAPELDSTTQYLGLLAVIQSYSCTAMSYHNVGDP